MRIGGCGLGGYGDEGPALGVVVDGHKRRREDDETESGGS
jgi:hypothetical protein